MITFVDDRRTGALWDLAPNPYSTVVRALAEPIMKWLPDSRLSRDPIAGTLNVRFMTFARGHGDFFLSHGIADKLWREAGKVKHFGYIGFSGPLWKEKYLRQRMPESKLFEVGYTKLDPLFNGDYERTRGVKDRVLYAPTHSPRSRSYPTSYPKLMPVIERLRDEFDIVIATHPKDHEGYAVTMQELLDADVVIADAGSTLYEAWALGKPVIFPDWIMRQNIDRRWPNSFEQHIYHRQIGYHAQDEASLRENIRLALEYGITPSEEEFAALILPVELRGRSGQRTAEVLSAIVQGKRRGFAARTLEMEKRDNMAGKPNVILRALKPFTDGNAIPYRTGNRFEATATEAKDLVRRKLAAVVEEPSDSDATEEPQKTVKAPEREGPDIRTNPVGTDRATTHLNLPNTRRRLVGDEAPEPDVTTEEVQESTRRGSGRSRDLSAENAHKENLDAHREASTETEATEATETTTDDGSNTAGSGNTGSTST